MAGKSPEKADFEKALKAWFDAEEKQENPNVDIRAEELHQRVGDYPEECRRMATCCQVMYENYKSASDKILHFPPKGQVGGMEIRYALPRPAAVETKKKAAK
jgi:hypothetical protein